MNSLAFFHLPLKEGHVPKRLVGVSADAIVGWSGIGLSGGIGNPGSGSLDSFSGSGLFDSSSGSGASSNLASKGSTSFLGGSGGPGSGSLDFLLQWGIILLKGLIQTQKLGHLNLWVAEQVLCHLAQIQIHFLLLCKFLVNLLLSISFVVLQVGWLLVVLSGGCRVLFLQCNKVLGMWCLQWIGVLVWLLPNSHNVLQTKLCTFWDNECQSVCEIQICLVVLLLSVDAKTLPWV